MKGTVKKDGASWYYYVRLGKDKNGKWIQKKKRGFHSKKEAEAALIEVIHEFQNGLYVPSSTMLYSDFFNHWIEEKAHVLSPHTSIMYRQHGQKHILPCLGHVRLNEITPRHIQTLIELARKEGLQEGTIRYIYSVCASSLTSAVKQQLLSTNPAHSVEKPKQKAKQFKVWDEEETLRFLSVAKQHRYYIVFLLAIMTGMRQGEILGLRVRDIDISRKTISINRIMLNTGKGFKEGTKTAGSSRMVVFPSSIVPELEKVIQDKQADDPLFLTSIDTTLKPSNIGKEFRKLLKEAHVPKIKFHDLRHTHATLMLKQGVHPKIVAERLGHSRTQLTLDTYSHVLPSMQMEAADNFGRTLLGYATKDATISENKRATTT
jgi:integrase